MQQRGAVSVLKVKEQFLKLDPSQHASYMIVVMS